MAENELLLPSTFEEKWWERLMDVHFLSTYQAKESTRCCLVRGGGRECIPMRRVMPRIVLNVHLQLVKPDLDIHPIIRSQYSDHSRSLVQMWWTCREQSEVFQDFLTKWPLVFSMPYHKTERIVQILVDDVVPFFKLKYQLSSYLTWWSMSIISYGLRSWTP